MLVGFRRLFVNDPREFKLTYFDLSYLFFVTLRSLQDPGGMSQNQQISSSQQFHNPSYNPRNTLKRQEDAAAKSKSEPPKRSSPF